MAIELKNRKKCRNITEQVAFNDYRIGKLEKRTPTTDYVEDAYVDPSRTILHITKLVDGEEEEIEFVGGAGESGGAPIAYVDEHDAILQGEIDLLESGLAEAKEEVTQQLNTKADVVDLDAERLAREAADTDLNNKISTKTTVSGTISGVNWKTITIDNATANIPEGGGEPDEYLKKAEVSGNTLNLINKDGVTTPYTPDLSAYRTSDAQDMIDNTKATNSALASESSARTTADEALGNRIDEKLDASAARLVNAVTSGSTLTITKQDGSTVVYNPTIQGAMNYKGIVASTDLPATGNNGDYYMLSDAGHEGQCAVWNGGTNQYDFGVATVTADATTSTTSVNPVQNQAITNYVDTQVGKCLPLTGGTMKGPIVIGHYYIPHSSIDTFIQGIGDTGNTFGIWSGSNKWNRGAGIELYSTFQPKEYARGCFWLWSINPTNYKRYILKGSAAGRLTWSERDVLVPIKSADGITLQSILDTVKISSDQNFMIFDKVTFVADDSPDGEAGTRWTLFVTVANTNDLDYISITAQRLFNTNLTEEYKISASSSGGSLVWGKWTKFVPTSIQTTAPSEAITDGGIHFVKLAAGSTGVTEYDGYIYLYEED